MAKAKEKEVYNYKCTLVKVVDGDTIDIDLDLGFDVWLRNQRVRLYGIDTPESRTRNKAEKVLGLAAKEFLAEQCRNTFTIASMGRGKFGRILGELYLPEVPDVEGFQDRSLNTILLDEMLAVQYYGQSKEDIINQHLINVEHHKAEGRI